MRSRLMMPILVIMVLVVSLASPFGTAPKPVRASVDSAFGVNTHIASRYPNYETLQQAIDTYAQTDSGWAREDFQFFRMEPARDHFDWGFHDRVMDGLSAHGINIIGILNGPTPGWAVPGKPANSFYPPDPQTFAAFATAVVQRYKDRVHYWQIWNEPDNPVYWQTGSDPAAYTALLKVTAAAIRATDPTAHILAAGLVSPEPANSYLRGIADNGGWDSFDIVAIHPYTDPRAPEDGQIDTAGVGSVRTLVDRLGSKPIWATEFGWATSGSDRTPNGVSEEAQADYLIRSAVLLRGAGADHVIWYNLKDNEAGHNSYGLLRTGARATDYSSFKPAFDALRTLNQQLGGTVVVGTQDLGSRQVAFDFETVGNWRRGDQANGTLTQSSAQVHSGGSSAQLSYSFPTGGNDYVVFSPRPAIDIGSPTQLGIWVYGDGSGHALKVWLRDAQGEVLQYRLGFIGSGWQFLSTPVNGRVESYNRISGSGNLTLDLPASLNAIVLDDEPDSSTGSGSIYLDDLTAVNGPQAYSMRFQRNDGTVVDVLWSLSGGQVAIPTSSDSTTIINRSGGGSQANASSGAFHLDLSPSPVFITHRPGTVQAQPQPPAPAQPDPQPAPAQPAPVAHPTGQFADDAFYQVWSRTDKPVAEGAPGLRPRSWLWGPQPLSEGMQESYAEGVNGMRLVQYSDKSRMEINNPYATRDGWYVTNGLLVEEMMTGRIQVGNSAYEEHEPADQAVAGDPAEVNPGSPTYRSLRSVCFPVSQDRSPQGSGGTISTVLARDGSVSGNTDMDRYGLVYGSYDDSTGHNVAQVFDEYFRQHGVIFEGGRYGNGLIVDGLFAAGHPLCDPFWARVRIGGVDHDVLMQAFERRVLTYTPDNAPEWRVEMGNVGQHYYRWRYNK